MELQQHTQHILTTGGIGLLDAIQPQTAKMIYLVREINESGDERAHKHSPNKK